MRALVAALFLATSYAQSLRTTSAPQAQKEIVFGMRLAREIEDRDGRLADAQVEDFVQGIGRRISVAAGGKALDIRITRSSREYAALLPNRIVYLSARLLLRAETEAELAGVLAHVAAHAVRPGLLLPQQPESVVASFGDCVLATESLPGHWRDVSPQHEVEANAIAIRWLEAAGYDPESMLDILSKLACEHPRWPAALLAADLLSARTALEAKALPEGGYRIDSSGWQRSRNRLESLAVSDGPTLRTRNLR